MPIAQWLRALRRKPAEPARPQPLPLIEDDAVTAAPSAVDNGVRMHIASSDPAFPAKREAAVTLILGAIDTVASTHGLTKKARSWAKTGACGTISVHLQRSRYGFECYINLGFQPVSGESRGPWAQDDVVRLGRFMPTDIQSNDEPGALIYLDILEDTEALATPLSVLDQRALPWLLAHLEDPAAADRPFLPGPTSLI